MAVTRQVHSVKMGYNIAHKGFALIEVMIAIIIVVIISTIAPVSSHGHIEFSKTSNAIHQIAHVGTILDNYNLINKHYPDSLIDIGMDDLLDLWNNPYQYNIIKDPYTDISRKDHHISTLNTEYDLYSMGKDGASVPPLTAKASRDDVIRANNGSCVGPAADY